MFSVDRVLDAFHVSENDTSVAQLQTLHEVQVVADLEILDWLLLQTKTCAPLKGKFHHSFFFYNSLFSGGHI